MIKLFCDKCGEKITDKYYTIAFTEHDLCSDMAKIALAHGTVLESYYKPTAFEELNSQIMYCKTCKDKLKGV